MRNEKIYCEQFKTWVLVFAVSIVGVATASVIDPLDDSLVFKLGMRGDLNANGQVDANEVFNAMAASGGHVDTTTLTSHASDAEPMSFTNVNYLIGGDGPIRPDHVGDALYFPFSTKISDGKVYSSPAGLTINTDMPTSCVFTAFARMRWDGTNDVEVAKGMNAQMSRILFRYNWLYSDRGAAIVVTTRGDKFGFGFYVGKTQDGLYSDSTFRAGDWIDAFFTFAFDSQTQKTTIYSYAYVTTNVTPVRIAGLSRTKDTRLYYADNVDTRALTFGVWSTSGSWGYACNVDGTSGGNSDYIKSFHGALQDFRIWNRELSEEERRMVVSDTYGAKWRIGASDGSSDEFAEDGSADLAEPFDPDTMPWFNMRGKLTASHPALTLQGTWTAQDAALPALSRVLSVKPIFTDVPGSALARLTVNGAIVGTFDLKTPSGRNIFIPAKFWNGAAGSSVTMSLTRVGDIAGTVALDSVVLGGSWQTGFRDGLKTDLSNREWEYNCYFAGNPCSSNMIKTIYGPQSTYWGTRVDFKVHVPDELAARHRFLFETAVVDINGNAGSVPTNQVVGLYVNDELKLTKDNLKKGTPLTLAFDPGTLKPGLNVFRLRNLSDSAAVVNTCWLQFDYYSLTCKRLDTGMVVMFR